MNTAGQCDRRFGGREEICSEVLSVSRDITSVLELLIYELLAFSSLFWELKNDRGREKSGM